MNLLRRGIGLVGCLLLIVGASGCSGDRSRAPASTGPSLAFSFFELCVAGPSPFDLRELGDLGSPPTPDGAAFGPGVMSSNPCQLPGSSIDATARGLIRADFYSTPSRAAVEQLTAYVAGRLYGSARITTGTIHGIAVAFIPQGATKNLALTARDKAELSTLLGGLYDTNVSPNGDHSLSYVGPSLAKTTVDRVRSIVAAATGVSPSAVVLHRHPPN